MEVCVTELHLKIDEAQFFGGHTLQSMCCHVWQRNVSFRFDILMHLFRLNSMLMIL